MIAAFDIDLHKVYGMRDDGNPVLDAQGHPVNAACDLPDPRCLGGFETVLIEIASPTSFGRGGASSGVMFNLAKWAIFNVATITKFWQASQALVGSICQPEILVAPSDRWTLGFDRKVRHAMVKATAKNKDQRECQAMLAFYRMKPALWVPFHEYVENL